MFNIHGSTGGKATTKGHPNNQMSHSHSLNLQENQNSDQNTPSMPKRGNQIFTTLQGHHQMSDEAKMRLLRCSDSGFPGSSQQTTPAIGSLTTL